MPAGHERSEFALGQKGDETPRATSATGFSSSLHSSEGWEVPLTDAARRGYLRDNVLKVFKFD